MVEGFVFYGSFYEAISELDHEDQLAVYDAICRYGLFGEEPECNGIVKAMFKLVKPQIDANNKRREAGRKGGEATAKQNEAELKQTEAPCKQTEATCKQTEAKEKEKVKEKDKEKDIKDSCPAPSPEDAVPADVEAIPLNDGSEWRPTKEQYDEYVRLYPAVDVKQAFRSMRGWCTGNPKNRKTRTGVARFVTSWLSRDQDRTRAAPKAEPKKVMSEQRSYDYDALEAALLGRTS